jgi:hypothetical protein
MIDIRKIFLLYTRASYSTVRYLSTFTYILKMPVWSTICHFCNAEAGKGISRKEGEDEIKNKVEPPKPSDIQNIVLCRYTVHIYIYVYIYI